MLCEKPACATVAPHLYIPVICTTAVLICYPTLWWQHSIYGEFSKRERDSLGIANKGVNSHSRHTHNNKDLACMTVQEASKQQKHIKKDTPSNSGSLEFLY